MSVPSSSFHLSVEIVPGIDAVSPAAWDALVAPDDPFCTHSFLSALERSGSAGAKTGWAPAHVLVRAPDGLLVGGAPVWIKDHSYGEFIFDWGWADASHRAGIPYYPKLVCAVPFTPATGRRLLVHPSVSEVSAVEAALWQGMRHVADRVRAMSIHVLFCTESEHRQWTGKEAVLGRVTSQFHWHDQGYGDFDGWLSTFRSKVRKETRRERRRPAELGVVISVVEGGDLTDRHWDALEGFYRDTVDKKGSHHYLTPAFFQEQRAVLAPMALAVLAEREGEVVAGALAFQRGTSLFGRYWGCLPGFESLHFEVCYHRPIELCLERGWTHFEAGAQGQHKLRRGLLPAEVYSLHWLRHSGLAAAVARALSDETEAVADHHAFLLPHGPGRRGEGGSAAGLAVLQGASPDDDGVA